MFFVQLIIATFSHVSLETEYNAVRVINYTTLRGLSSLSVRTMQVNAQTEFAKSHKFLVLF